MTRWEKMKKTKENSLTLCVRRIERKKWDGEVERKQKEEGAKATPPKARTLNATQHEHEKQRSVQRLQNPSPSKTNTT
jgi:hypothetical protein